MKDKVGYLTLMTLATLLALAALANVASANGYGRNFRGYSYSHQQTYRQAVVYPYHQIWQWAPWSRNNAYYIRGRWTVHGLNNKTWANDGSLYTLVNGKYCFHSLIANYREPKPYVAPYVAPKVEYHEPKVVYVEPKQHDYDKQFGDVVTGIETLRKEIAGISRDVAVHADLNHEAPKAYDLRDFLPEYKDMRDAELASDERKLTIIAEANSRNSAKRLEYDHQERQARLDLANREAFARSSERLQAQFAEGWAAAGAKVAVDDASKLEIDDADLERDIRTSCFACHGGSADKGTAVDFKNIGAIDWMDVFAEVATGSMPKGGEPWSEEQLARLKAYAKKHPGQ